MTRLNDYDEDDLEDYLEWLTPYMVMEILGISKNTCYKLLKAGVIKGERFGRSWRVRKGELLEF
ncbi:MAG: helix-turn-helix domain-containing protein [Oscillospiraceae bacterium]